MKNYWLIRVQDGPVEGPFTAAQIKSMAGSGEIKRQMLIADDSGNWVAAERIKGMFESSAGAAVSAPPTPTGDYGVEPPPVAAQPRGHVVSPPITQQAGIGSYGAPAHGPVGRIRSLTWFVVLCSILAALGLVTSVLSSIESTQQGGDFEDLFDPDAPWMLSDTLACSTFIGLVALWIVWVVWIYKVHAEISDYSSGTYPTSPGLALGLCFVPFFNIYWNIAMPYKLAQYLETNTRAIRHSARSNQQVMTSAVSAGSVMALQIVGTLGGCCFLGANMLLFSISALLMQRGLNDLWRAASPDPV